MKLINNKNFIINKMYLDCYINIMISINKKCEICEIYVTLITLIHLI